MKNLFATLEKLLAESQPAMLVTVVGSSGSAPGGAGAHMLVTGAGRQAGTIGGGAVEHRAETMAATLLKEGRAATHRFTLTPGDAEDLGMVCGGQMDVWFYPVPPGEESLDFARAAAESFSHNRRSWLVFRLSAPGAMALYSGGVVATLGDADDFFDTLAPVALPGLLSTQARQTTVQGQLLFSQPLVNAGRAVVFGGGHVAQALVPLLSSIGFYTLVFEDRADFAQKTLFPTADECILGDFSDISARLTLTENDWLIVLTRGHAGDFEIQRQVLGSPHAYVGVIGSRAKTKAVNKRLLAAGIPRQALDTVHTPIGLAIGAKTPAEIAISIAAEIIQIRSGKDEAP